MIKYVLIFCIGFLLFAQNMFAVGIANDLKEGSLNESRYLASVNEENIPLTNLQHEITKKVNAENTYQIKDTSVGAGFNDILEDMRMHVAFSDSQEAGVLRKDKISQVLTRQSRVTGTVTDAETGEALPGVNILVKGTTTGTTTNANGKYELNVESLQDTLRFSYIGYKVRLIPISGRTKLNVKLKLATTGLEEMVVTATGATKTREIGTNISSIKATDFNPSTITNTQEVLVGNVAGATVLSNSGQPGTGATIRLRGNNSISQNNNPIVYIDGVRMSYGNTPSNSASGQSASPLNDINPNNIESINVVNGPAATTLYGTEASGGVIRITTKQGFEGKTVWNANITEGFNNIGHFGPKDDNPTGLFIGKCRGDNLVSSDGTRFQEANCPSSGSWLRNGLVQRYNLSVASGMQGFTYHLSGNFSDEKGVIYNGGGSNNYGISGNFNFTPNKNISLKFHSLYNHNKIKWVPQGNNGDGFVLNVTRGPGGHFSGASGCEDSSVTCVDNSEILNKIRDNTFRDHYINSLILKVKTSERLQNRITIGLDYNAKKDRNTQFFGYKREPEGSQSVSNWQRSELSFDYLGTYKMPVSKNVGSTFNWGGQFFKDNTITEDLFSEKFSGPQDPTLISGSRTEITGNQNIKIVKGGIFGQASFSIYDQLYITAGVRVDGHSSFGSDFGWQVYPKVSGSYVLSDYDFWPSWWSNFRIRAAIGESGQAPGPFDAVRTWRPIAGDDGQPGFTPNKIGNPDLGPEISREIEGGFNASFIDSRFEIDFTYYNQKTTDALIAVPGVPSQGFISTQLRNVGKVKNTGIETKINLAVIRHSNLNWNIKGGFSQDISKVLDLGGLNNVTIQNYGRSYIRPGYAIPGIFGKKIQNPNEKADPVYKEDQYYGPNYPDKTFTLGTTLRLWQQLKLDISGVARFGGYMVNGNGYQNSRRGVWPACYRIQQMDVADVTAKDRARCAVGGVSPSYDNWIESTDYFRLKNLSLTYNFPKGFLPEGLSTVSLTLSAKNLLTATDYSGTDPTIDGYSGSLARRDYYVMPTYRTFMGTLNFSF